MPTVVTAPVDALEILSGLLSRKTDIVLIDGRSGAGKSSLAIALKQAALARGVSAQLVHIEQVYQGWDGLAGAALAVARDLVVPFAQGKPGFWDEYDWERERVIARHTVLPIAPLIVEGVGALHPLAASASATRVWVTTDDEVRKERALHRDGSTYEPHWYRWAAQEEIYVSQFDPAALADIVVDTTYNPRSA